MKIQLVAYRAEHLQFLEGYYHDGPALTTIFEDDPGYGVWLELACKEKCFSFFTESWIYLGSMGFAPRWRGVADLWMILSGAIRAYPIAFTRFCREKIELLQTRYGYHRINAEVDALNPEAMRWAEIMGFVNEGLQANAGPNRENYYRYARIRA